MFLSTARVSLQILLIFIVFTVSEVHKLTINTDKSITININSSTQVKNCNVCTGTRSLRRCDKAQQFKDKTHVSVELECPRHEDIFRAFIVEIKQNIECTTKSCNGHIIQTDSSFPTLLTFNRTFTWNLKASAPRTFKVDFTKTGLTQIHPSERCPDNHSYTLQAFQTTGSVTIGKYCRVGIISSAQIQNWGSFSVEVPAGKKLQNDQFDVSVGEEIKSLAKITLTFPKGNSSTDLFSPNYPGSFPDDDVMEWYFQVPDKHNTSVKFLNLTQPHCLKKRTAVEYHSNERDPLLLCLSLTNPKSDQNWGNVSLTLRNCEMNRSDSSGLSVKLKVSTSSTSTTSSTSRTSSPGMLAIILSVVTSTLAILVLVLLVACMVIKKKNKNLDHQKSIQNQNSNTYVLPGQNGFPKTSEDEYHVYATVDELLVYSHLLKDDAEVNPLTSSP